MAEGNSDSLIPRPGGDLSVPGEGAERILSEMARDALAVQKEGLAKTPEPGTVLWEFETGHQAGGPSIGNDGTVYVGSVDKKVYAIKTDSKGLAKSPWPMRGQNAQHTGLVMKK